MITQQQYELAYEAGHKGAQRHANTYLGWEFWKLQACACKVLGAAAINRSRSTASVAFLRNQAE